MTNAKEIRDALQEMYAVTLLEYHDKNLLSGDNKSRNVYMQETLLRCISIIDKPTDAVGLPIKTSPMSSEHLSR